MLDSALLQTALFVTRARSVFTYETHGAYVGAQAVTPGVFLGQGVHARFALMRCISECSAHAARLHAWLSHTTEQYVRHRERPSLVRGEPPARRAGRRRLTALFPGGPSRACRHQHHGKMLGGGVTGLRRSCQAMSVRGSVQNPSHKSEAPRTQLSITRASQVCFGARACFSRLQAAAARHAQGRPRLSTATH